MNSHFDCKKMREEFLDLAQPGRELSAAGQAHVRECAACAAELAALRQTWAAMDAWQAPEPSAYFDSRLQARLREEQAQPARGWLSQRAARACTNREYKALLGSRKRQHPPA